MSASHHALAAGKAPWLLLIGATLAFIGYQLTHRLPVTLPRAVATPNSLVEKTAAVARLPFTFDDVVDYFVQALEQTPTQRSPTYARFDGGSMREGLFSVMIERHEGQMLLRFHVIDDYGMNVVREFFEAPFFQSNESERLYGLLYAGEGMHSAKLSRFDVLCDYQTRPDETVITLFFSTPPQQERSPRL